MTSSVYTAQIQFLRNDHITPFPSNIMKFTHAIFNSFCFRIRQTILHSVYYCVPQNIIALHAPFIPYLPSISLPPEVDIYFCVPRRDKKRLLNSQIYANASVPLAENMQETKKTYLDSFDQFDLVDILAFQIYLVRSRTQLDILV